MKVFNTTKGDTLNQHLNKNKLEKAIEILHDMKALEAKVIEVSQHCSYTDHFILVSATSKTHAQAISDELQTLVKRSPQPEGYDTGQWILNDLGEVVVHIFLKEVRGFYQLDKLWSHAPTVDIEFENDQGYKHFDKVS